MEFITGIKTEVEKYLKSAGCEVADTDLFLLDSSIEKAKMYICNKTNQKEVPQGLKHVWIERAAGEFLTFKLNLNQLDINGLNFGRIAKEISEGDTKVVYDNSRTTGDKLGVYLSYLTTAGESELIRYRRLIW